MANVEFIDYASSFIMQKQVAELYERTYPYAAEDFVNNLDNQTRQTSIDVHLNALLAALELLRIQFNLHVHTSTAPGNPTGPNLALYLTPYPPPPILYTNTTGSITNFSNTVIPFVYLSYIDSRTSIDLNKPIGVFRRSVNIPINAGAVSPPLIRL